MAHGIQILSDGTECFVENTDNNTITPAWHGLGVRVNEPMTIEDAMSKCHADFKVSKQPVVALTPQLVEAVNHGDFINASMLKELMISGASCNMRTDNKQVMAITSDTYGLIQNVDAFRFLNNICGMDESAPLIETMGVLTDGTTFASIRMKNVYSLSKNDDVDLYLIVKNSFNNKESLSVFTAFQRVVCQNTLNAAFKGANSKMFIKHTRYANNRLADFENAAKTLKFYELYKNEFAVNMERLKSIKLTDKECEKIICKTIMGEDAWKVYVDSDFNPNCDDLSTRTKNMVNNAMEVLYGGVGQNIGEKNTGLYLYNGITSLYNNHTNFKTQEKKFNSIFGGSADEKQQIAFDLIFKSA